MMKLFPKWLYVTKVNSDSDSDSDSDTDVGLELKPAQFAVFCKILNN